MYLNKIILDNFRSYPHRSFEFSPRANLICGSNGSGKTNILESVFFLSSGKSFRSSTLSQLMSWGASYTTVVGNLSSTSHHTRVECQLIHQPSQATTTRKFLVDQVARTRQKYLGTFKTVVFEPEDIRLVAGSPSRRRDVIDIIFCSVEWQYATALSQYHRALKHRNELLDLIRTQRASKSELFYWDQALIKNASIIQGFRQGFFKLANSFFGTHPSTEIQQLSLSFSPSIVSADRLEQNYNRDLQFGHTQHGPHRDDFEFRSQVFPGNDKNLGHWGSRGQQRLAVLALRLAQIYYLETTYHQKPVLLLDDIFSELDSNHRYLVNSICQDYQTIFTSADVISTIFPPETNQINLS
jgi:DNA replication and repair protein RecF